MATARFSHSAAVLPDGRVMVCGGSNGASGVGLTSCEAWNPATNQWVPRAPMNVRCESPLRGSTIFCASLISLRRCIWS